MQLPLNLFTPRLKSIAGVTFLHVVLITAAFNGVYFMDQQQVDHQFENVELVSKVSQQDNSIYWATLHQSEVIYEISYSSEDTQRSEYYSISGTYMVNRYREGTIDTHETFVFNQTRVSEGPSQNSTFLTFEFLYEENDILLFHITEKQYISFTSEYDLATISNTTHYLYAVDLVANEQFLMRTPLPENSTLFLAVADASTYGIFNAVFTINGESWVFQSGLYLDVVLKEIFDYKIPNSYEIKSNNGGAYFSGVNSSTILQDMINNRKLRGVPSDNDLYEGITYYLISLNGLPINIIQILSVGDRLTNFNIHLYISTYGVDIGEGWTGENNPEYLVVDVAGNQSQAWDITPLGFSKTHRRDQGIHLMSMSSEEIVLGFVSQPLTDFYQHERYWYDSPEYDEDATMAWLNSEQLHLVRFAPLAPSAENYVQFDQQLTSANTSKVVFPRPTQIMGVPQLVDDYNLESSFSMTYDTFTQDIKLYVQMFETVDGFLAALPYVDYDGTVQSYLPFGTGTSMVEISFNVQNNSFSKPKRIIGPVDTVSTNITLSSSDESVSDILRRETKGWTVDKIYQVVFLPNDGHKIRLSFIRASFQGTSMISDRFASLGIMEDVL